MSKIRSSKRSLLLLGPRQVGKSTLILSLQPDLIVNLAREQEFLDFAQSPDRLERMVIDKIARTDRQVTVFIDEVQRLPSLLNTIQVILDQRSAQVKFYLSGSSARKLKRGNANLLPGRIHTYEMGPLCAAELSGSISTEVALATGTLPGIWFEDSASEREKTLKSYSATYLREEIQAESLSRNLEGFARFIGILGAWNGRTLDLSKLAQAAQVSRTSVSRWFEIVEETLIIRRVESYTTKLSHRLVRHPKLYFFDNGVANGLLANFIVSADRKGILFENLILSQLHATAMAYDTPISVETFRTEAGVEVDFVVRLSGKLYAIEVKSSQQVSTHDLKGLLRFKEIVKEPCEFRFWYTGDRDQRIGDIEVSNWVSGLTRLGWGSAK